MNRETLEAIIIISAAETLLNKAKRLADRIKRSRQSILEKMAPLRGQHEDSPRFIDRLPRYENVRPTPQAVAYCEEKIAKLEAMLDAMPEGEDTNLVRLQTIYAELGDWYGQMGDLLRTELYYRRADRLTAKINIRK